MTCPACNADLEPTPIVHELLVCQSCGRSLVMEGDTARFATSADLEPLDDAQIKQLRKARPKAWRDAVLATKARIKGR